MRENDFLPDHLGVADGQLPQTLANIAEVEADRGVYCARSGKPIEISRASALAYHDTSELACQTCGRCR